MRQFVKLPLCAGWSANVDLFIQANHGSFQVANTALAN